MKRLSLPGLFIASSLAVVSGCAQVSVQPTTHHREHPRGEATALAARDVDEPTGRPLDRRDPEDPPRRELDQLLQTGHSDSSVRSEPPMAPGIPPAPSADEELGPSLDWTDETPLPTSEHDLTLEDLEQVALNNNPTLRQAFQLVQQARGNWQQVGLYPNPTIGYEAEDVGEDGGEGQHGGFVEQQIVTGKKLDWNRTVAAREINQVEWQAEIQRLRVVTAVRIGYYRLLGAQELMKTVQQVGPQFAEFGDKAEDQLRAGQIAEVEALPALIARDTYSLQVENLSHQQDAARRELAVVLGVDELPPGELSGSLGEGAEPLDFETEWQHLRAASPVLQTANARVQRARAQLSREQVQPIPDLNLRGSVRDDTLSNSTLFSAEVGIQLPIHNRNQGNISAAAAAVREAIAEVDRLELVLRESLSDTVRRHEIARSQVEKYATLVPNARKYGQYAVPAWENDTESNALNVLLILRNQVEVQSDAITAKVDLRSVEAELEGLLMTDGLQSPDQPPGMGGNSVFSGMGNGSPSPLTVTPSAR